MSEAAEFALTRARIALIKDSPFYGTLALRLRLVADPSVPTLAVDGKQVIYNPAFIETLTPALCTSAMAHEVGHCAFAHISRRGERDPRKWNRAGDYVINYLLQDAGFELGEGWLYDAKYANMSAEEVYALLPDAPNEPNGGALDEIMDAEQQSADHTEADEWKIAVIQAATQAQQAGKLPANLKRLVDELVNPKVDWRTILRRFVTEQSKDDYSWSRPAKMMIPHGFYLPTLFSENMGTLVVIIDTSGSIDQHQLDVFGSETNAIRVQTRPKMTHVIYCDAAVNHVDSFGEYEPCEFKMHGGGNTDFRPPFERIAEMGWQPAAILYFTDGHGTFPDAPPAAPTLWCMTTEVQPPWGEVVQVDIERGRK